MTKACEEGSSPNHIQKGFRWCKLTHPFLLKSVKRGCDSSFLFFGKAWSWSIETFSVSPGSCSLTAPLLQTRPIDSNRVAEVSGRQEAGVLCRYTFFKPLIKGLHPGQKLLAKNIEERSFSRFKELPASLPGKQNPNTAMGRQPKVSSPEQGLATLFSSGCCFGASRNTTARSRCIRNKVKGF